MYGRRFQFYQYLNLAFCALDGAGVLGGASLFGGRGSFLGVLFGALLIQEVNSATTFLGLSQAWQYWFIGLLTLCAVAVYSQAAIIQSKSLAERRAGIAGTRTAAAIFLRC
jgi:ribose/xylose/arabinose/galactoside ABC-type transport system permease subunit